MRAYGAPRMPALFTSTSRPSYSDRNASANDRTDARSATSSRRTTTRPASYPGTWRARLALLEVPAREDHLGATGTQDPGDLEAHSPVGAGDHEPPPRLGPHVSPRSHGARLGSVLCDEVAEPDQGRGGRAQGAAVGDVVRRTAGSHAGRATFRPARVSGSRPATAGTFADVKPVTLHSATLDGAGSTRRRSPRAGFPSASPGRPRARGRGDDAVPQRRRGPAPLRRPRRRSCLRLRHVFLDAAPTVFACFDQPDLKAPYTCTSPRPPTGSWPATPAPRRSPATEPGSGSSAPLRRSRPTSSP